MQMKIKICGSASALALLLASGVSLAAEYARGKQYLSHPPCRPKPELSVRPLASGQAYFVDATNGDDVNDGTKHEPWRTLRHGLEKIGPGDTLYLRGGTYYENVVVRAQGTDKEPVTIRGYPGELAVVDGGYREFLDDPSAAWEPVPGGGPDEFRSTKEYPELGEPHDPRFPVSGSGVNDEEVRVMGNFADSMVPLHGYAFRGDLCSSNEYWNVQKTEEGADGFYCGPGVWLNPTTKRIHIRLAHHTLRTFGRGSYRGQRDPRKLPLVITGRDIPVRIHGAEHVRVQDLLVRGTRNRAVNIDAGGNIELDGVTIYGGAPAVFVRNTVGLRLINCALRGMAAPWSSRSSMKYRGASAYLLIADGSEPPNREFEIAFCEFTDSHDGLMIGTIDSLRFHHNLVDNFNDDGLYLTYDGHAGRDIQIYRNLIQRCLTSLAFAGSGGGQEKTEVHIFRNLFDLRGPVPYALPSGPESPQELTSRGRTCGDHGSPIWKPMFIHQNTVLLDESTWRHYYGGGLARATRGSSRRLLNNIFFHTRGQPGFNLEKESQDLIADGNLHWGLDKGMEEAMNALAKFRASAVFQGSKAKYKPGWTAHDVLADPLLVDVPADWRRPADVRLRRGSPAIDAGVELPEKWPDALREKDGGNPDIGALPLGAAPWRIGVRQRIAVTPP